MGPGDEVGGHASQRIRTPPIRLNRLNRLNRLGQASPASIVAGVTSGPGSSITMGMTSSREWLTDRLSARVRNGVVQVSWQQHHGVSVLGVMPGEVLRLLGQARHRVGLHVILSPNAREPVR